MSDVKWYEVKREPRIFTFMGKPVNPLALQVEDIHILDIAHALALQNRFVGHTRFPISVAQHSVFVCRLCNYSLKALLHDASEAYLGDVSKWVKQSPMMEFYRGAEKQAQTIVYAAFGMDSIESDELKEADALMVRWEAYQGWHGNFVFDVPAYDVPLTLEERERIGPWEPWNWEFAEERFLQTYLECLQRHGWDPRWAAKTLPRLRP